MKGIVGIELNESLSLRNRVEWDKVKDKVSTNVMRVLIANDELQVRLALRLLLRQYPDMAVVGEADNVERALELAVRQQPNLVLLDWELPGGNGTAVLERLRTARQGLIVIVLSGRPEARRVALDAGVDAFVSKGDPPDRLVSTLQATLRTSSRDVSVGRRLPTQLCPV